MKSRKQKSRVQRAARRRNDGELEWIGGCLTPPFFITDRDEPYRPTLVVWMELPYRLVVGHDVVEPEASSGAVGRTLLTALERPLVGPARRPARVRVQDASLVREIREVLGDEIPIDVAPTPELDELIEAMPAEITAGDEEASYFEGGRVSPEVVAKLFSAARLLFGLEPWKMAHDGQVLRMDIPALGVDGACVSIIGALGENPGVLIFPSLEGYEAFRRAAEGPRSQRGPVDLGTGWVALSFECGADLPKPMRREAAKHGWPVASTEAYPLVERWERDGAPRPLRERDVEIAAACASSLSAFFLRNGALFASDEIEPVCESFFDEDDREVWFTAPYEAFPEFDIVEPGPPGPEPRFQQKVSRNDPCPCGSGRKYKKCHLPRGGAESAAERVKSRLHDLDARMVRALWQFADKRFGDAWRCFEDDFQDADEALQLSVPWSVYTFRVDGRTVLEAYLEARGKRCSAAERAWLAAQQAAWLSVWEVTEADPGKTLTLRDLLSGETRCVLEAGASQMLVARDALLARVVDHDGVSLLCGAHPRELPPFDAAEVVRRARGRLRRKRAVPVERLRDEAFGRYLIRRWEESVAQLDEARENAPELQNTDGDPLLLTTDHFEIASGARPAVEARLAALEGVEPAEAGEDPLVYVFLRPGNEQHTSWDNTVIGRASVSDQTLELETNSRERADALRERVEAACGARIRHRAREHADALSTMVASPERGPAPEPPPPELEQLLAEFKQRHYADWPDQSLPALGGKTPREASRTAGGRAALDVLLKDMENQEQRSPSGPACDFSEIRRALRLD